MIGWGEIYQVLAGMAPLYVALGLGYASVKWWQMFEPDQCDSINRFNCYFIIPFFVLNFIVGVDPYHLNFRFLAADVIAKAIAAAAIAAWAKLGRRGNFAWAITSFSIACFNNTLVVGVPLLRGMYGADGEDLVVQSSVLQFLVWMPILLLLFEFQSSSQQQLPSTEIAAADATGVERNTPSSSPHFQSTLKKVAAKLAKNPNCYACSLGIIWALIGRRWNFKMPIIVEGCILIMGKAGSGMSMFTVGQFMALNNEILANGFRSIAFCLVMRFVVAPLTTVVGSLALGLKANILNISIMESALPQASASFVFAQEYNLHANTLSTAVTLGTIISLPLLIAYYAILNVIH